MGQKLEQQLTQSQALVLTPAMKIALKILELPVLELGSYLQELVLANPVVELAHSDVQAPEWRSGIPYHRGDGGEEDASTWDIPDPSGHDLYNEVAEQLFWSTPPGSLRQSALYLVGNLEPDGYLRIPLPELAETVGASIEEMQQALAVVQACDPAGVGARSLQECLLLQATRRYGLRHPVTELLQKHWDVLRHPSLSRISRTLKISPAEANSLLQAIRKLNPVPASGRIARTPAHYLYPDLIAQKDAHGTITLDWAQDAYPRLQYVTEYLQMTKTVRDSQARQFLSRAVTEARWIEQALRQRQKTVMTVTSYIVKRQAGYCFERDALEPLSIKDVAHVTALHESTVRRAISGKILQCPRGLIPISSLLCESLSVAETTSIDMIKSLIRNLILEENPHTPLSDAEIAKRMTALGIPMARRTVAKYRQELGFAATAQRRQPMAE
ncbi:RNA polymerase, sigma 54 subunit, RpoN/SigL [Sulfobacillus acidophilus DSM 10332]|uniref:RNA polymerase, sigma 54 subunit, RpoN/SigL n=1 Tax=Sulfobacillus acidophilus (strain ATCC 700253 / DSM 10332 / NAL) TaxID=679936 RepID=G8TZI5_SULAD|nr:RNA polymerase, sigma 54 subunit, RpoN/SigL [Sulfobacillus acidophilus DSM 10332]